MSTSSANEWPKVVADWTPNDDLFDFERWRIVQDKEGGAYSLERFRLDCMNQVAWYFHDSEMSEKHALCARVAELEQSLASALAERDAAIKARNAAISDRDWPVVEDATPDSGSDDLDWLLGHEVAINVRGDRARRYVRRLREAVAAPPDAREWLPLPSAEEMAGQYWMQPQNADNPKRFDGFRAWLVDQLRTRAARVQPDREELAEALWCAYWSHLGEPDRSFAAQGRHQREAWLAEADAALSLLAPTSPPRAGEMPSVEQLAWKLSSVAMGGFDWQQWISSRTTEEFRERWRDIAREAIRLLPASASSREREDCLSCEIAWGIIANAFGGDWSKASADWRGAAERWRDEWHRRLAPASAEGTK